MDLAAERRNGDFVRGLITTGSVTICHDISDGGLLVAVAEMALAGDLGATLNAPPLGAVAHGWLFGEDQARYVIAVDEAVAKAVTTKAQAAGVAAQIVGEVGGAALTVFGENPISLAALRAAHENWLPDYMAAE
jgi:phosphoribosylformylglycinamidine synthase